MKKCIATAITAAALGLGGAASAQDLGSVITNILGFGSPTYGTAVTGQVYTDQYGRQYYYDQYGRTVFIQAQQQIVGYDNWGRPIYGTAQAQVYGAPQTQAIVGYDSWGRPIYGSTGSYAYGGSRSWDRDGDGVPNSRDRWPDDPRYR